VTRSYRLAWIVCVAVISQSFLIGCRADSGRPGEEASANGTHELLNAVLWVQTAAEYEAICEQTFALARARLDEGLGDPEWTAAVEQDTQQTEFRDLPPAVIVDVDETVLGNSQFDARLAADGIDYDKDLWKAWVRQASAKPLPGAQAFIEYAREKGVDVFFVTNRWAASEEKTLANLRAVFHADISEDELMCRGEIDGWGPDKTTRRSYLAQTHRIVLLLGDDLNDFISFGDAPPEERIKMAHDRRDYWGSKWIIFPNPIYGSWERALYGYNEALGRHEKLRLKHDALDIQK
jgi:5'-nucleotidase (lipoprotein e(P4) family)